MFKYNEVRTLKHYARVPKETSIYEYTKKVVRLDGRTEEDGVLHLCDSNDN